MVYNRFDYFKIITNNTMLIWKNSYGIASDEVSLKLDKAMLNWHVELTNTLEIWINKGLTMTDGELILARANLGAVVESWLKFFYSVYYDDYLKKTIMRNDKIVEPEKIKFEKLKEFSTGILWDDKESYKYKWVDSVQNKRNAIHSFEFKKIGTAQDFLDDIEYLYEFVNDILSRLPPLEDCVETYPAGYKHISPFFKM